MWQQWLNVLLGLWLVVSPNILATADDIRTNLIVSGIAVAVLAVWGALEHRRYHLPSERMG